MRGCVGERLAKMPCGAEHRAPVAVAKVLQAERPAEVLHDQRVKIVSAECGVPACGNNLEYAARQAQHRDIEGAPAKVVDGIHALRAVIEPVGDRRCGRLVEQTQHADSGKPRGVSCRLALRIVEVGRHGDDCAHQGVAQDPLGQRLEPGKDPGCHVNDRKRAALCHDLQGLPVGDKVIRHA